MLEHKRPTTSQTFGRLSQPCGEKPRAVRASKKGLRPSPSTQTTALSETVNSVLGLLISCHKGLEVEPWTEFKITPDPDGKDAVVIEMFSDQEVDVIPSPLSHHRSKSVHD